MHPSPPFLHAVDIAILGGGLAGSAAAVLLAEQGWRVALFEQHRGPRHKMCGEFLSPETVPLFQRLGVWEGIAATGPARITTARVTEPGGRQLNVALPAPALGFSRWALDARLMDRARAVGAGVWEGCAASRVEGTLGAGFRVETQAGAVQARVVLGAWGKRSTLDRTMARPFFARRAGFLALKAHFRGPETGGRTELHAFPGGYCGLNRVEGDAVNVCLLATDGAWARAGRTPTGMWAMIQVESPALRAALADAEKITDDIAISNISFAPRLPVEQDVLMLGDSAALISPLAGNGQAMALQSAFLAAPLVSAFLQSDLPAEELRARYAEAWQHRFGERLRLGRLLQPLFLHPSALALGLRVARGVPPLAQWLVAGTREREFTSRAP